jgi:long-chain acyl-CoA synthetase
MSAPESSEFLHELLYQHQGSSRVALVSPEDGLELSYADLCRHSRALAARLRERIAMRRQRIVLLLPASPEFVVALFAVSEVGGVAIPLDIYTKPEELRVILRFVEPALIITNASLQRKIKAGLSSAACCLVEVDRGGLQFAFCGDAPRAESAPDPFQVADPEEDAVFILTSGTTGHPKAVRLSHRAIRRNIDMHLESLALQGEIISLQVLPVNYSYGLNACLLSTLRLHGTTILTPHVIEPKLVHALVERYGANLLMGSPVIFQYLLQNRGGDFRALRSLRYLTVGGDRCRPNVAKLIRGCLPWTRSYITYGLSEAGPRVSTLAPQFFASLPQSVGRALRGVEIAILDPAGCPCPPGEPGEVVLQTPSLMNGYFRDDVQTAARVRDGWLFTGDFGRLDADGFLRLLGRRDGEFKFRGRRVHPGYIEQIIFTHPDVQEVHVTRVESAQGEHLLATLKARVASEEYLVQELKSLCRKHLPAFLVPSEFLFYDPHLYHFKGRLAKQIGAPPEAA